MQGIDNNLTSELMHYIFFISLLIKKHRMEQNASTMAEFVSSIALVDHKYSVNAVIIIRVLFINVKIMEVVLLMFLTIL